MGRWEFSQVYNTDGIRFLVQGYFMVAHSIACAVELCFFSRPRWDRVFAGVSSDEERIRERDVLLCCYGFSKSLVL